MVTENVTIIIRQRGAKATAAGIRSVGVASGSATTAVRGLVTAIVALGGAIGANQLRAFADDALRIGNRVRVTTNSTAEYVGVLRRLRETSNKTRTPLEQNAELFARLRVATRDLGTSTEDVLKTTEGLTAAIAISGARTSEATNGLIQLAQGLASGRLQGDELRSVLENLPPLAQKLADELGVTVGELRKLGEEGKLNAETVFPALLRASSGFVDQLKDLNFTTAQSGEILKNEFLVAVGAINNTLGATNFLNEGIGVLAQSIGVILVQAIAFGIETFADLLRVGASVLDLVDEFGLQLPTLGTTLGSIGSIFQLFFRSLETGFRLLILGVATFRLEIIKLLARLRLVDPGSITKAGLDVGIAQGKLKNAIGGTNETLDELIEKLGEEGATKAAGDFADTLSEVADKADAAATELRKLDSIDKITIAAFGDAPQSAIDAALAATGDDKTKKEVSAFAKGFGGAVRDSLEGAVVGAFKGEGFDAVEALADLGGSLMEEAFSQVFDGLEESLTGLFESLGESLGGAEGIGGAIGGAIAGGIGIGLGFLARELSGTSAKSRNDLVQSATQSAQATRGIVAGPTSIPIFQVGQQLEEALIGTEDLLAQILAALQTAPSAIATSVGGEAGGASADLSLTTPTLA